MIGDIGTFAGLVTDENTQVLNAAGKPIKGLYAVGNDAASVMGGNYPGAGITLGPALTFGYVAAMQLAKAAATVQSTCKSNVVSPWRSSGARKPSHPAREDASPWRFRTTVAPRLLEGRLALRDKIAVPIAVRARAGRSLRARPRAPRRPPRPRPICACKEPRS